MAHKRNGKEARARRKQVADAGASRSMDSAEKLLIQIFSAGPPWCSECGYGIIPGQDCLSPHCRALRNEFDVKIGDNTIA